MGLRHTTPTELTKQVGTDHPDRVDRTSLKPERDVFLSHCFADKDYVKQVRALIEKLGFSAYVDWMEDKELDREEVTGDTAETLKNRMRLCRSLIFVVSEHAENSAWMPWELGFFDGFCGNVGVFAVSDRADATFKGQEYLQLYPQLTADSLAAFLLSVAAPGTPWLANPERIRAGALSMQAMPEMATNDPLALYAEWNKYWFGVWHMVLTGKPLHTR